ncbi:tetratricopeptide repeat protein [Streptomyces sp. HSW2009]|uniref:tetratricopeptide repeat protein n=1 Tax=Streptomyces sp. HSW2009 TaxID=3142890 RepID=UPI0032F098F4
MVLVVGDSTAGKTRAAFEALRATLPGHRVLAPAVGVELPGVVEAIDGSGLECVVWLDDMEKYLGPGGLEPGLLAELARLRVPVVGTMRAREWVAFTRPAADRAARDGDHAGYLAADLGARVLNQVEPVELDRIWSEAELVRARECDDVRIVDATTHHGPYGIAEYLAAGPALLAEWRRAWRPGGHPRGAALVAAAVDLARTGLPAPYATDILVGLHGHYLKAKGGARLRPEPADSALEWAAQIRYGATSLLIPAADPHDTSVEGHDGSPQVGAWEAFDYLVDHTSDPIPDAAWQAALAHAAATLTRDGFNIGLRAYQHGAMRFAEVAWRAAIGAGDADAANNYGVMLSEAGRIEDAEFIYRLAADVGHHEAAFNLGQLLSEAGRIEEAETVFRAAADAGYPAAANSLGVLLADAGRTEEAEAAWCAAAEDGYPGAAYNLGILRENAGRIEDAEHFYRAAADAEHPNAAYLLGALLRRAGRIGEAEAVWRAATAAGEPDAANSLGALLKQAGRVEEAEAVWRAAADAGHLNATYNLAMLLLGTGRAEEAVLRFWRAVRPGIRMQQGCCSYWKSTPRARRGLDALAGAEQHDRGLPRRVRTACR